MSTRTGFFLICVSLVLLIIFFASDQANNPAYPYFCWGVIVLFAGVFLIWRGYAPPPPSERFKSLRKSRAKRAEKKKD